MCRADWPDADLGATMGTVRISPRVESVSGSVDLDSLASTEDVSYFIDGHLRIEGLNDAWVSFAESNGGNETLQRYGVGTSLIDGVAEVLRPFVTRIYTQVLERQEPHHYRFECHAPAEYRAYLQRIYAVLDLGARSTQW